MATPIIQVDIQGLPKFDEATQKAGQLKTQIDSLKASTKAYQDQLKTASDADIPKLNAAIAANAAQMKSLRSEYNSQLNVIKATAGSMEALRAKTAQLAADEAKFQVGVSGTQKDLEKLRAQLANNRAEIIKHDQALNDGRSNVGRYAESLGTLKGALTNIAGAVGISFGVAETVSFLKSTVAQFREASEADAQLNAALTSTGHAAGLTKSSLDELATSLMKQTRFDDDAIKGAEALLLTFTNIHKDVFPKATEAILNVSEALHQDLQTSTQMVGKALNDPIQGMIQLRRVGVDFSDDQKNVIKAFTDTGDVAGAQNVILQELQKEFGGVAKAMSETPLGKMDQLKVKFDNLKESIGGAITSLLGSMAPALNKIMDMAGKVADQWSLLARGGTASYRTYKAEFDMEVQELEDEEAAFVEKAKKLHKELTAKDWIDYYTKSIDKINEQLKTAKDGQDPNRTWLLAQLDANEQALEKWQANMNTKTTTFQKTSIQKQKDFSGKLNQIANQELEQSKTDLDNYYKGKQADELNALNSGAKTQQEYDAESQKNELQHLQYLKQIYQDYGQNTADIDLQIAQKHKDINDQTAKADEDALNKSIADAGNAYAQQQLQLSQAYANKELSQEEYDKKSKELTLKAVNDQIAIVQNAMDAMTTTASTGKPLLLTDAQKKEFDELSDRLISLKKQSGDLSNDLANDIPKSVRQMQDFANKYAQTIKQAFSILFDAINTSLQNQQMMLDKQHDQQLKNLDTETAALEAQKQAEEERLGLVPKMTAAEKKKADIEAKYAKEEADKKQKIEDDYQKKTNEIQSKQFEAQKAEKIAGIIMSGAEAALTSFVELGPAGPIIAGILTAAEVAVAAAQKNPYKFAAGGFTGNGSGSPDNTGFRPAGVVHEGEWVAPKWMVESPALSPSIALLEAQRQSRGLQPPSTYYASGGHANAPMVMEIDYERLAATISQNMVVAVPTQSVLNNAKNINVARNLGNA